MSESFWQDKIKAFLHDPPDKALILFHKSHERKVAEIWSSIYLQKDSERLIDLISKGEGIKEAFPKIYTADMIASTMQRLSIPQKHRMDDKSTTHIGFRGCKNCIFWPEFRHTLSGNVKNYKEIDELIASIGYENFLEKYGFKSEEAIYFSERSDLKKTYFLLWRFLPEKYPLGYLLPADTRIPDHSIWDHLDVASAVYSCLEGGLGLFSIKIPAVQEFISHSRKLVDLWASSHIFSTIIFEGIRTIVEKYGPDVVIYPQLRGNPMLDTAELNGENGKFRLLDYMEKKEEIKERIKIASFPNTFLCFVPVSEADKISENVEKAIRLKWVNIASKAKEFLNGVGIGVDDDLWDNQVRNAVEVTSAWLEFFNLDKFNNVKNEIPEDLKKKQEDWLGLIEKAEEKSNYGYFYSFTYEILGIILAQKSRFWSAWEEKPEGKKCLMCGRRNALIENHIEEGYRYWNHEKKEWVKTSVNSKFKYILKSGERLCACCLTKRVYKQVFKEIFNLEEKHLPEFESIVEVAGRVFIDNVKNYEEFQLLKLVDIELIYPHEWESKEKKETSVKELEKLNIKDKVFEKLKEWWNKFGEPSKYYAILMMDGDKIGKWLSGERWIENGKEKGLPYFEEFLHTAFKNEIQKWEKAEELTKMKRILTPSHHIAISRAMKDFSLYVVKKIVEKHKGFLVYTGGDDVLALFPTDKVLYAAKEIQESFKKDFYEADGKTLMGLGNKASMSAGIVFVHYNWPLYDAIERVRETEKRAKNEYGRNAFCITFVKHSGKILTAGGSWEFLDVLEKIREIVKDDEDGKKNLIDLLFSAEEKKKKLSHRFINDLIETIESLKKENGEYNEPFISMLKAEIKRLLRRRNYNQRLTEEEIKRLHEVFLQLVDKYVEKGLSVENVGMLLKILYDAYRGEER